MRRCIVLFGLILLLGCQSNRTNVSSATGSQVGPKVTTMPAVAATSFEWAQDYDRALAAARATDKIVMVDVYTDWCGWCKRLDKDAFSNTDVTAKLSEDFVAVKINPEKSETNAKLAKAFGTRGYPHVVFLDTTGKKVAEIGGYLPATEFLKKLNEVTEQAKKK